MDPSIDLPFDIVSITIPQQKSQKESLEGTDCSGDSNAEEIQRLIHDTLMNRALVEATKAGTNGEVPIGAILVQEITAPFASTTTANVRTYQVLSTGQNQIETLHDASAHAELQTLRSASYNLRNWRLPANSTLYTTLEPCPMCLAAAQAFRVGCVVYGAPDLRLGAVEGRYMKMVGHDSGLVHPFHPNMHVVGGVKKEECAKLLVDFFRERRKNVSKKKVEDIVDSPTTKPSGGRLMRLRNRLLHRRTY